MATSDFCLEAFQAALILAVPGIVNTDQGSQFTSKDFVGRVKESGAQISMDGKGRCLDNVWIERFWRTIKYEELYLNEYESVSQLWRAIQGYVDYYNNERRHQGLKLVTPAR